MALLLVVNIAGNQLFVGDFLYILFRIVYLKIDKQKYA